MMTYICFIDIMYGKEDTMNNLYVVFVLNNMIDDVTDIKLELNSKLCKTSKMIVN